MNERDVDALMAKMTTLPFVAIKHGPANDPSALQSLLADHLRFIIQLEERGLVFCSGPLTGEDGSKKGEGLTILKNISLEEAKRLWTDEPFYKAGIRQSEFFSWSVNEAHINLSVRLSQSSFAVE